MKLIFRAVNLCIFLTISISCILKDESPIATNTDDNSLIQSGDIVITNLGNDSIVLLDNDGRFKASLYDVPTDASISFPTVTYDTSSQKVLFTYDSTVATLDAVYSINPFDGEISTYLSNSNLTGTMTGLARLTGGELLVLEATNTAEKFLADGTRSGAPFIATLTTNVADINPLSTGGFIVCSSGTANTVRTYNAAGVVQATATSALPTPTLGAQAATACLQDSQGRIIVAYSGTTDAVRVYTSVAMTTVAWTYTDTNHLTTPTKLALRSNGNILVGDSGFHHIVELTPDGGFVQRLEDIGMVAPTGIVVIP